MKYKVAVCEQDEQFQMINLVVQIGTTGLKV
jgi:hypothetical protein